VKTLDRNRIDQLVRELETDAYRLALAFAPDSAAAEAIVVNAFAAQAPSLASQSPVVELKGRIHAHIRRRAVRAGWLAADERAAEAAVVSDSLHLRIVDLLEEEQAVEPVGRRRAVLLAVGGVLLVGALTAFLWVRADALAAAQPSVTEVNPPASATEVPVRGDFSVTFGSHPVGTPTLRLEPSDGVLDAARWDGSTLIVSYSGLHLATRYQLVLKADYRSRFKDVGHLVKRWSFTAEGYPVLVKVGPSEGSVTRIGALTVDFNHRPPVDPQLQIVPADGSLDPGHWNGSTWVVGYEGLKPRTTYEVTAVVDYGVRAANIRRQWTFTTEPGAPPAGTAVIWYSLWSPWLGPGQPQRLVAIDWSGSMVGTMYQTPATQQSPDGSILTNRDNLYFDRTGAPRRTASTPAYYGSMLADDNHNLCEIGPNGTTSNEQWVFIGRLDGPSRPIAPVGTIGARSGIGLLACSVLNDRVVAAEVGMTGISSLRVLTPSTGHLLYQRTYSGSPTFVISSHDGKYLAEQTTSYDTQGVVQSGMTLIRRTSDGQVVARIDKQRVVRFSWDDVRVVTAPLYVGGITRDVDVIEWQSGKILWRSAGDPAQDGGRPVYAFAQPNGPGLAIAIGTQPKSGDVDQLFLVGADGQATQVVSEVFYPAFVGPF
jgi:hypothetical protein